MDDLTVLRLQIEWGADEALEDVAVNRLREASPPQPSAAAREGEVQAAPPALARRRVAEGVLPVHATPAERALQAAAAATTLDELRAAIAGFDGCALRDTASNLVFAQGDPTAALLLIGDPPGAAEDRSGMPFAGAEGAYLDKMLGSIGLQRAQLMLTPLIPWRPPGDRPPSQAELAICLPFLHRLIAQVAPRRLLLMGLLAARALLSQGASRRRARGTWMDAAIPGTSLVLPALATFSAAELMRSPRDRRAAWADLRRLRRTLDADAAAA